MPIIRRSTVNLLTYEDVIRKYFAVDGHTLYFLASDRLRMIEGEVYLTYKRVDNKYIELYYGGSNFGEACIRVCWKPEQLEALIRAIVY
jgi:hypothetical protein